MENGEIMKEILELIYTLEDELDNAYYSLPEYDTNADGMSYLDFGRNTVYELKTKLEELKREIDLNV